MGLVRRRVEPDNWQPVGIKELEANAWEVVWSVDNRSVLAGPGSGKTELLAQRASYLLQCGVSRPPRRILAISYKRDAAFNLGARVRSRCHPTQAHRFDSMTFDAFAKSLVDRFGQALPSEWRPKPDYNVAFINRDEVREFLRSLSPPSTLGTKAEIMSIVERTFEREFVAGSPIPNEKIANPTLREWVTNQFWHRWLHGGAKSALSFTMIGRLAEFLVRTNPMVKEALCLTYSHLFMDEFQDTTQVQYDLVKTIFRGSATVVTAVGDNKQHIMRWAMAMDDAFTPFEKDFAATRTPLHNNYRSSPELVKIQGILAQALDAKAPPPVSKAVGTISGNSAEIWDFADEGKEAKCLAEFVSSEMKANSLTPRDFTVLVRKDAAGFAKKLLPAFSAAGIQLRNEAATIGPVQLQDLLGDDLSDTLLTLLRFATKERAGAYWTKAVERLCNLREVALEDEAARARVGMELDRLAADFVGKFPKPVGDRESAKAVVKFMLDFVERRNLLAWSPAYRQGDWLDKLIGAATVHLEQSCKDASNWDSALDVYEGLHVVPLMTVHKSKGLEYHTVIFVGLEDENLFNYVSATHEETAGFFVAFTRAKQRVVFTYCEKRGDRDIIAPLYELLDKAGVKTIKK